MEAYVDGAGGAHAMRGMSREALHYSSESMMEFKKGVDEMIADLLASPAAPKAVGADPVARGQFGGGGEQWIEAHAIFSSYKGVLAELTRLSGLLSDCLEGMGIAVGISKNGMEDTDDDIRGKMLAITRRVTDAKAAADKQAGYDTTPSGKPDATTTGAGVPQSPAAPAGAPEPTQTAAGAPEPTQTAGGDADLG
ncbi:hypothetical protein ACFYU9_06340 [Streptomyces sp. NPDC004327]|uniref:hypothetical protein n=1 Tax=Streptomyces sp. NPDC004327 TaxID=3364699 RepID=UPI00368802DE